MFVVTIIVTPDGKWAMSTTAPHGEPAATVEQVRHVLGVAWAALSVSDTIAAEPDLAAEPEV